MFNFLNISLGASELRNCFTSSVHMLDQSKKPQNFKNLQEFGKNYILYTLNYFT